MLKRSRASIVGHRRHHLNRLSAWLCFCRRWSVAELLLVLVVQCLWFLGGITYACYHKNLPGSSTMCISRPYELTSSVVVGLRMSSSPSKPSITPIQPKFRRVLRFMLHEPVPIFPNYRPFSSSHTTTKNICQGYAATEPTVGFFLGGINFFTQKTLCLPLSELSFVHHKQCSRIPSYTSQESRYCNDEGFLCYVRGYGGRCSGEGRAELLRNGSSALCDSSVILACVRLSKLTDDHETFFASVGAVVPAACELL